MRICLPYSFFPVSRRLVPVVRARRAEDSSSAFLFQKSPRFKSLKRFIPLCPCLDALDKMARGNGHNADCVMPCIGNNQEFCAVLHFFHFSTVAEKAI